VTLIGRSRAVVGHTLICNCLIDVYGTDPSRSSQPPTGRSWYWVDVRTVAYVPSSPVSVAISVTDWQSVMSTMSPMLSK
jgi:hypothetical protein